jgi:hypothetical protein
MKRGWGYMLLAMCFDRRRTDNTMTKKKRGQTIDTTLHRKLINRTTQTPLKTGGELKYFGKVRSSCSTLKTRRGTLGKKSPTITLAMCFDLMFEKSQPYFLGIEVRLDINVRYSECNIRCCWWCKENTKLNWWGNQIGHIYHSLIIPNYLRNRSVYCLFL